RRHCPSQYNGNTGLVCTGSKQRPFCRLLAFVSFTKRQEWSTCEMARDKVILAYSGGLDTSVMVPWIGEKYNLDVVAFTVDLGQAEDIERIRQKALKTGAVDAVALDARNLFVDHFVWPALMAGALYEGKYPLATALGRPLIAKLM